MSLLMDALKRAETSKQEAARAAAAPQTPVGGDTLALEPIAQAPAAAKALPELAAHIDALDAELASGAPPSSPPAPAPEASVPPPSLSLPPAAAAPAGIRTPVDDLGRATARNAFAAKQAAPRSRSQMWLALGVLSVAAVGIGAYVWYQVQSIGGGSLNQPAPGIAASAPAARPLPPAAVPAVPLPPPATPASLPPLPASTATAPVRPVPLPQYDTPQPTAGGEAPGARMPIRLTRSRLEPDANAQRGYASLQGNQVEAARRDYELALKTDPHNVDTLLALAAIAQSEGRPADAERYRQRAVAANPADPAAQAAVLGAGTSGDPQASESRLKLLLAAQPESAPLNFALGNLYARQGRWPEAQPVYFNAVAADGDNPDYLFNLAVSLDHLRQPKLAAQHYRLALDAAQRRPAAFDRERVRVRLGELQP
jgi:Tfp pilus assembly protein PilF